MKKFYRCSLALILSAVLFPLSAADYGALLYSSSEFSGSDIKDLSLEQNSSFSAWLKLPFNNSGSNYFASQASINYEYDNDFNKTSSSVLSFNVDLFKFSAEIGDWNLSAGRFELYDISDFILAQQSDGIILEFLKDRFTASAYAGWTGLLNAHNVTVLNKDDSSFSYDSAKAYDFASSYGIFSANFSAPYLFFNQSFAAETFAAIGTRGINGDNSGYNRFYLTLLLNGALSADIFYSATCTMESENFKALSNLSSLKITAFIPFRTKASISFSTVYASGKNGFLSPFKGITSITALHNLSESEYTGLLKSGISFSIKPIKELLIQAGADFVLDTNENIFFKGSQAELSLLYSLTSDLKLNFACSEYFASGKESVTDNKTYFALTAELSF